MKNIKIDLIELLTKEIEEIFSKKTERQLVADLKADDSIVTEIDYLVSNFLKAALNKHPIYQRYNFFSEEDFKSLNFPAAIVDPIDGTRELAKGRAECAVSLALMHSNDLNDPLNFAWLYNPFTGFSLDTDAKWVIAHNYSTQKLSGMVSRSEYHKGYYSNIKNDYLQIMPRGSIAFKLGLLASGACDFVVSLHPKNIWDIAAGTILIHQRGFNFFVDGKPVETLEHSRYQGVLVWCKPEHIDMIMYEFQK